MTTTTYRPDPRGSLRRGRRGDVVPQPRETDEVRPLERALLTPEEAARVLGIGRNKAYELILAGSLKSLKIGACRRMPADAIKAFITALREEQR